MSISKHPSTVTLPPADKPYPSLLEFLVKRFPNIEKKIWETRISEGKITDQQGDKISFSTRYSPGEKLHYFRESPDEPHIPFKEEILFENEEYLIADKPHFLPVIPSGAYVNECLLSRLKERTGNDHLTPVNRIDRETAGLVVFSCNKKTRGLYSTLFLHKKVQKTYEAVTEFHSPPEKPEWVVKNRMIKGNPWFRMQIDNGEANAETIIRLLKMNNTFAHFQLTPVTGKKHQLRLHLSSQGYRIVNDRYYPVLLEKKEDNFKKPLQLLSKKIEFTDPVTGNFTTYTSRHILSEDWGSH